MFVSFIFPILVRNSIMQHRNEGDLEKGKTFLNFVLWRLLRNSYICEKNIIIKETILHKSEEIFEKRNDPHTKHTTIPIPVHSEKEKKCVKCDA